MFTQIGDTVTSGCLCEVVQERGGQRLDARTQSLYTACRERLTHQRPQPPVVGSIGGCHSLHRGERHQRPAVRDLTSLERCEVLGVLGDVGVRKEVLERVVTQYRHAFHLAGKDHRRNVTPGEKPGVGGVRAAACRVHAVWPVGCGVHR